MGATRRNLQIPKKIIGTPNLPIKTKIFPKKYVKFLKSEKEPKTRMGATRRNLQAQLKILKKSSKHQINQSKRIFSPKNYASYIKIVMEPKIRIGATRNCFSNATIIPSQLNISLSK
jgi:hypothetical protein